MSVPLIDLPPAPEKYRKIWREHQYQPAARHTNNQNQQSIPIDADADVADADQIQTNMTMAMSFRFLSDAIYFTHHSMELQHQAQRVSLAILQVFPT